MKIIRRFFAACWAVGFLGLAGPVATGAATTQPLLMPGKHSLYQRVLSRPGAVLRVEPGGAEVTRRVVPFSVYYVYASRDEGAWLRVGTDSHGSVVGWLPSREVIPWNQALTVAFNDPVDHDRVLLFRDRQALNELVRTDDVNAYRALYREAEAGMLSPDSPVVAIQPKAYVDLQQDFYLVPIQAHEDVYLGDQRAQLLKVATVPLVPEAPAIPKRPAAAEARPYRAGLVFVVDSTISMGPYIDRTRDAVRKVYEAIDQAHLEEQVGFGLVAYRDNIDAVPGLDYLTRTYATLKDGLDPNQFFSRVDSVKPARVSSRDFNEDAYAGIKQAIEDIDWNGYDARYLVLVTDAGARPGSDPLSGTGLDTESLRQLARDRGVAIWVLHLLTPLGASNHASAARQYRALSQYPGIGSFYYGVETGDVARFGHVLDSLAAQITDQVRDAVAGKPPVSETTLVETGDTQLTRLQGKVAKLGYALRMRYLQRQSGIKLPSVFEAWLVDHDIQDPSRATVDVRVLLTRDQLSDLHYVLRQVLNTAEDGLLSPKGFINDLKSLAASLERNPDTVGASTRATGTSGSNLADLGYMREYIEDLPYTGEVMNLSLEDWESWPASRQLDFLNRLEDKINYYQALHDHTDLWVSLGGGPIDGDSVFPVALEMLP